MLAPFAQFWRLCRIAWVFYRFGLEDVLLEQAGQRRWQRFWRALFFFRPLKQPGPMRLRLALESLGPLFVKFGQALSTRQDLFPEAMIQELSLLQEHVPPFSGVREHLKRIYGKPPEEVFLSFSETPVASASVAQVHEARLPDGRRVAVKVLRPSIRKMVAHDIAWMRQGSRMLEWLWKEARLLRAREVVEEFAKNLDFELDLLHEAANASHLRHNFLHDPRIMIPEMHWDFCHKEVLVMDFVEGIPVTHTGRLRDAGVDLKRLARVGVEIFFAQVARDRFFHADMHPGNLLVNARGQYVALDFGIMGSLNETDLGYLMESVMGLWRRDYRRVALVQVQAGWAPADTPVDDFAEALRTVGEPLFDKPLKEISLGLVLTRVFALARRYRVQIQPQLLLLQKTVVNVEGLGRTLDPDIDIFEVGKPLLESWGWRGKWVKSLAETFFAEARAWPVILPALPRLAFEALSSQKPGLAQTRKKPSLSSRMLWFLLGVFCSAALFMVFSDWPSGCAAGR